MEGARTMPYKDPEKRRECQKRYRDAHKEYYKQKQKEFDQKHPEKKKARRKRYYETHKSQENQQSASYRLYKHRPYNRIFTESGGIWKCIKCGATREDGSVLCIHHIDFNHDNNTPSNLVCLCLRCHSSLHGKFRSATKKGE